MILYHGSHNPNIDKLYPISKCNEDNELKVVYLTENKPYALFYIWDEIHTKRKIKWVTCWIKNGIVHYEEQFSNQLFKFYNKVSGFIYSANLENSIIKAKEPEMWYTTKVIENIQQEKIKNVYNTIMEYEKNGKIIIHRYNKLSRQERYKVDKKMCDSIIQKDLLNKIDDDAVFMKKHHKKAWKMAIKLSKQKI